MSENRVAKYTLAQFTFDGYKIPARQREDGSIEWSLTNMAKVENARVTDWLRTEAAQELIKAVEDKIASSMPNRKLDEFDQNAFSRLDLIRVENGGKSPGTWCSDRRLVLAFAAWLSPAFHVWMLDQIIELSEKGFVNVTKSSIVDLRVAEIYELANSGRAIGKKLKSLCDLLNTNSEGETEKILDTKLYMETFERIIRGVRDGLDYEDKNRFFKSIIGNFEDWRMENSKTANLDSTFQIVKFLDKEYLGYRGRVIGQRERRQIENLPE
jgi:hypothetical protein